MQKFKPITLFMFLPLSALLKITLTRITAKTISNCDNTEAMKFPTRLCLGQSNFSKHKFRHSFQYRLNSLFLM